MASFLLRDAWTLLIMRAHTDPADPAWTLTKPYRNRQLHQTRPRSVELTLPTVTVTVNVGGKDPSPTLPVDPASSVEQFGPTVTPGARDVNQHDAKVSTFTPTHWTSFWQHL
jgi:hypothetical protein